MSKTVEQRRIRLLAPSHIAWTPGDNAPSDLFSFREAGPSVLPQLLVAPHSLQDRVGRDIWERLVVSASGVVRVSLRNQRHLAGYAVSEHSPDLNEVYATGVHEKYRTTTCLADLLTLAALEVPEAPLRVWVPEGDVATQKTCAALGMVATTDVPSGELRFDRRALASIGPKGRRAVAKELPAGP